MSTFKEWIDLMLQMASCEQVTCRLSVRNNIYNEVHFSMLLLDFILCIQITKSTSHIHVNLQPITFLVCQSFKQFNSSGKPQEPHRI